MNIRPTTSGDIPALQQVVEGTELFPADMLPELIADYLSNSECEDRWLTCETNGNPIGFCYTVPERLAEGTWNMLALAVLPDMQRSGAGRRIVEQLENDLRLDGQRVLIVDTSGREDFAGVREFYRRCGYTEEARIRDFWAAGDDKVIFWKAI